MGGGWGPLQEPSQSGWKGVGGPSGLGPHFPPGILVRCWILSGPRAVHGPHRSGADANTGDSVEGEIESGTAVETRARGPGGQACAGPGSCSAASTQTPAGLPQPQSRVSAEPGRGEGLAELQGVHSEDAEPVSLRAQASPGDAFSQGQPPLVVTGRYQCGSAAPGPERTGVCCGLTEQRLSSGEGAAPRGSKEWAIWRIMRRGVAGDAACAACDRPGIRYAREHRV